MAVLETDDLVLDDMYEKLFLSVEENSSDYIMADFIIASKLYSEDIKQQLLSEGIENVRIYEYDPAVEWY